MERRAAFLESIAHANWSLVSEASASHDVNKVYDLFLSKYKKPMTNPSPLPL